MTERTVNIKMEFFTKVSVTYSTTPNVFKRNHKKYAKYNEPIPPAKIATTEITQTMFRLVPFGSEDNAATAHPTPATKTIIDMTRKGTAILDMK
ncbi:hypothetical protein [Paenibacillus sp. H1-7]|uniref:hypothetical protein n=1 Tax=Paenibacillus sp. H1-7 TaxID=2282849 RepID=UPI001EF8AA51|nr:hypothetical protein [Paenibacillus sp. H1-7]